MKTTIAGPPLVTAVIACAALAMSVGPRAQSAQPPLVFVGVNVVPMDQERVLENQTVLVQDGRIARIGAAGGVTVPAGAQRIDASGKYLVPGLVDMHVHLPPEEGKPGDAAAVHMQLYLANGITTIRGMIGHPAHITLRDRIARGELMGPAIFAAGPPLHGKTAPDPETAAKLVGEQKQAGFDLLKVHEGLSPDTYAAITGAAKQHGLPIAGHVTSSVGLERALAAHQSSIEHLDGYLQALVPKDAPVQPTPSQVVLGPVLAHVDESSMPQLARRTKEAGVYNTPTLTLFKIVVSEDPPEAFLKWPEMQYISEGLRGQFAKQKAGTAGIQAPAAERQRYIALRNRMVRALSEAGAGLLIGPDTPQLFLVPGFATHREMQSFVDAGLSPYATLLAATRAPAEYLGRSKEFGTIEEGKRADLLLVDANPLEDIRHLQRRAGLVIRGRWIPGSELERMLAGIAAKYQK